MSIILKDYQYDIYKEFYTELLNYNKCVLKTCTGTGKTYLTLKFLIDLKNSLKREHFKFLVVAETHSILDAWKKHINNLSNAGIIDNSELDIITYVSFKKNYKKICSISYDCVIFDEVHHAGAISWKEMIKNFILKHSSYKIGLTADPVRYSDFFMNVADELFDGHLVEGVDVLEAIEQGILPEFHYVMGLYDVYKNNLNIGNTMVEPKYLNYLETCLTAHGSLTNVLLNNMLPDTRKGIIFCPDIVSMDVCEKIVKSAFPYATFYRIHSNQNKNINLKILDDFRNDKSDCYLLNVDMVSEGIHIDNVNTLIMFRKTSIPTVFYQQLGRVLSGRDRGYYEKYGNDIVVFDFTCNSKNITFLPQFIRKKNETSAEELELFIENKVKLKSKKNLTDKEKNNKIEYEIKFHNLVVMEIINTLQEIEKCLDVTWKPEEDEIIIKYYKSEKSDIVNRLNNRTWNAIKCRANDLGVSARETWSNIEVGLLEECVDKGLSDKEIQVILHNNHFDRTLGSIRLKRQWLDIVNHRDCWTNKEVLFLIQNSTKGLEFLSQSVELKRWDINQIRAKCQKMHLKTTNRKTWTKQEELFLLQNFKNMDKASLISYFGVSYDSIKSKYNKLVK